MFTKRLQTKVNNYFLKTKKTTCFTLNRLLSILNIFLNFVYHYTLFKTLASLKMLINKVTTTL